MTHKNKADESHREAYGANSSPANTLNELGIHIHEYEEDSGLGRRRGFGGVRDQRQDRTMMIK